MLRLCELMPRDPPNVIFIPMNTKSLPDKTRKDLKIQNRLSINDEVLTKEKLLPSAVSSTTSRQLQ